MESELGIELLADLVLAPLGMVAGDALDEGNVFSGNLGTTDLAPPRPATPEEPESLTVPGNDGLRFDDEQGAIPARPELSAEDPEDAIPDLKPGMPLIPLVDRELLT